MLFIVLGDCGKVLQGPLLCAECATKRQCTRCSRHLRDAMFENLTSDLCRTCEKFLQNQKGSGLVVQQAMRDFFKSFTLTNQTEQEEKNVDYQNQLAVHSKAIRQILKDELKDKRYTILFLFYI